MYNNILVPIALDHRPNTGVALEVAHSLLSKGGKITAIHAVEPIPGYVANSLPASLIKEGAESAKRELVSEVGGDKDVKVALAHGSAGVAITSYADEHDVDLIVLASHQPGLQDYFLGSTAGRVVRHAHCAVHVVR